MRHINKSDRKEGLHYLSHVDGLRAIAIIPVVIYHYFPTLCPGGYAGVDVFFVISGYLITAGIIADLKSGSYSITDFYVRRIKRIFPAYVTVIGFILLTLPLFYTVHDSKAISATALYSIFYSANIYFYYNVSYFNLIARDNPLPHLWSLGVEEQFYLLILENVLFSIPLALAHIRHSKLRAFLEERHCRDPHNFCSGLPVVALC